MRSCTEIPYHEQSRTMVRPAQGYERYSALSLLHSSTSSLSKVRSSAIKRFWVGYDFSSVPGDDLTKFISTIRLKKKSYLLLDMQDDQVLVIRSRQRETHIIIMYMC